MGTKMQLKNEKYKKEDIKVVYDFLHSRLGLINEVASMTNYHRETVRLTLIGKRKKSLPIIMEAAAKVMAAHNEQYRQTMVALHQATLAPQLPTPTLPKGGRKREGVSQPTSPKGRRKADFVSSTY